MITEHPATPATLVHQSADRAGFVRCRKVGL